MQSKIFRMAIMRLLSEERVAASAIAGTVRASADFNALLKSELIRQQQAASGGGSFIVGDRAQLQDFFDKKFPARASLEATAVSNVAEYRNSKAAKRASQNVILLRGAQIILLNGDEVDLGTYTAAFGTFSCVLDRLDAEKVCLVENLDSYLMAEQVIKDDYIFIHTYGGLSKSVATRISSKDVLVFPDYDYVGLKNYLLVKSIVPTARLFVPDNYDELFQNVSRSIKTKCNREQQPSTEVVNCTEPIVVKIRTDIFQHRRFLEQQALFT